MQGENAITVRFSEAPKNKNRVKPSKDGCKKFQEALRLGDTGRFQAPAPLAGFVSHLFDLTEPNVLSDQKALDFLQAIGFPTKYVEVIGGRVRRCFRRERAQYEATQKRPRVFAREDADLEGLEHPEAYKPFLPGIVSREPTAQESPKGLDIPIIRLLPRPDPFLYYSSRHPDDVDKSFKVNPGAEEDRYPEPLSVIRANLNMLLAHFRKAEVAQELTSLLQDDILPGEGILRLPDVGCLPKSNVEQRARDHFAPGCVVKVSSWLGVVVAEILYLWANGFRLRRCFFCRNYFVPQPTQVRLCSDRCEKGQAGARVRKSRKKQAPCVT